MNSTILSTKRVFLVLLGLFFLTSCANRFADPQLDISASDTPTASEIFRRTFNRHGGETLEQLNDVNMEISGEWKRLIKRIQPLVTDFNYRINSEEHLFPNSGGYVALYEGPSGTKKVVRTPNSLEVYYNGQLSNDPQVLSSSALTADAFHLFLLGPLALKQWQDQFIRLEDMVHGSRRYYRLYLDRSPGFGFSQSDQIVLWVDVESARTFRIQITLEGHSTTQGAHVEVDFLDYMQTGDYLFPSVFFERVNAPIAIDAHAWRANKININRGKSIEDYRGPNQAASSTEVK